MPGDEESMSDEAIWETLPVSFVAVDIYEYYDNAMCLINSCADIGNSPFYSC